MSSAALGAQHSVTTPAPSEVNGARTTLTLIAMCLGAAMTFLEVTASISSLASVQSALHVSSANAVWIPSAYTLLVASLVLSAGTLGNRYGRKRMFCIGVAVLALGSVVVALAPGIALVLIGQAVAGVGGALILPNSVALLGLAYPDPHKRTEAITIWAASSGIGLAAGPIIAGFLLNHFSWHTVFLAGPVLAIATLALTVPVVAESRQPNAGRLDYAGLVLGTLAIAALVYALIQGGHAGFGTIGVVAALVLSVLSVILFIRVELRLASPMLDVRLFRSASFSAVMVVAAVALFGFTGVSLLEVLFFERVQNISALDTGWRLLVMFGPYVAVAAVSGRLIRRVGFKLPLTAGLVIAGAVSLGLMTQHAGTGFGSIWWLFALFGAASGLIIAPSTAAAMVSVGRAHAGMASGAVNTARQIGTVLGTSILGTLLTSRLASRLPAELAANNVPIDTRGEIETAVAAGTTGHVALPVGAKQAIGDAFSAGVHLGVLVNGIVFLAAAVLVVAAVHNRPQDRHAGAASARPPGATASSTPR